MNVNESTLKYDNCIGCGICEISCPNNAICMSISENMQYEPCIVNDKCISCGKCSLYCPNSEQTMLDQNHKVAQNPWYYGLINTKGFLCWSQDEKNAVLSASGGVTTEIIQTLFKESIIDAVVHACSIEAEFGQPHYIATLSRTKEDASKCRGSFYGPINFSKVLSEIKTSGIRNVLIVGTPCVLRGIRKYIIDEKLIDVNAGQCYSLALSCSHNVNGLFPAYLADSLGIERKKSWKINMRDKKNQINATNYSISFTSGGGEYF